jgi:DNA repair exonuclease SbcCD ATPase subunit
MPTIPHIEERKRLAELRKRLEALEREEEKALTPLEAEARKHREALHREFPGDGSMHWSDMEGSMRRSEELREKLAPFEDAIHAAREPFKAREAELHKEIDALEKITGSLRSDNEGRWLMCAITGLPLLESDEVSVVLAAALANVEQEPSS